MAGFFGRLLGKRPAAPAPPVAPAAPATAVPEPEPVRKRKRRAPPGEWNPALPQDARMWAIVAAEFGGIARHGLARKLGQDVSDETMMFHVRTAATCARRVLGECNPPRPLEWQPDPVIGKSPSSPGLLGALSAESRMRKLDERERARARGPRFDMSWPEWFATRFTLAFIVDTGAVDEVKRKGEAVEREIAERFGRDS